MPTKISYSRFPEWYFCPKCRKFQPIGKWIAEYQKRSKPKALEFDPYMTKHMQCMDCHQDLVVARIVTVCEHGHINDFPWVKWVHRQSKKPICDNPSLSFKTGASGTEGLEGLSISCALLPETCCEERNSFLDRGLIVGTFDNYGLGFYKDFLTTHTEVTVTSKVPFNINGEYTKKDIYRILGVPKEIQGGNWDTGYNRYNGDYFIFANIATQGRTGHDYSNSLEGNLIHWTAKATTNLQQPQVQELIKPQGSVYFFYRDDNLKPWIFAGKAAPEKVYDTAPVHIVWRLYND